MARRYAPPADKGRATLTGADRFDAEHRVISSMQAIGELMGLGIGAFWD